jgi:hypothetical protein
MLGARGFVNIRAIQDGLRANPPRKIGELKVLRFTDRWDETGPLGKIVSETDRAARDLLTFELEKDARIILRPSGTESKNKIYVEVCAKPLGDDAPDDALQPQKDEFDSLAREIAKDFTLEMLSQIGVSLPRYALEVSDLVPLEWKQDLAEVFLPRLTQRIQSGEGGPDLETWIDGHLQSYGANGRLLVKNAIKAYCVEKKPAAEVEEALKTLFDITL